MSRRHESLSKIIFTKMEEAVKHHRDSKLHHEEKETTGKELYFCTMTAQKLLHSEPFKKQRKRHNGLSTLKI